MEKRTKRFWHGHEVFDCPYCVFDTIEQEMLQGHILSIHRKSVVKEASPIIKVDRFGNEVKEN